MGGSRTKATVLLLALQLAGPALLAQGGAQQYVPAAPIGPVSDFANVVDAASKSEMDDLLTRLRGAGGAEIAVVTLPTVGDYEASEVALEIGRKWGVGPQGEIGDQRRNAGIVVLLVPRKEGDPIVASSCNPPACGACAEMCSSWAERRWWEVLAP